MTTTFRHGSKGTETEQATYWDLPNYSGELFTADMENTPLLTMMGGLTGGGLQTQNFEFPIGSEYEYPSPAQPNISEDDSLTAPNAQHAKREQLFNVTQIFHQAVSLSYEKLSNQGRLSGINAVGQTNSVADELAWQIDYNLKIIARNVEHTILNGVYLRSTTSSGANRTRGMYSVCEHMDGTYIDGSSGELSKTLLQQLFRTMFSVGAPFTNPAIVVNGLQKQRLTDIYGYAPESRNVGGLNIQQIETDFGNIGVLPAHRFAATDKLLVVELDVLAPVFQPVPGKGNFFYEDLSKDGASEDGQIYGKFGLDFGPPFAHGVIYNLDD